MLLLVLFCCLLLVFLLLIVFVFKKSVCSEYVYVCVCMHMSLHVCMFVHIVL